jgi:copper chaperone CopZ
MRPIALALMLSTSLFVDAAWACEGENHGTTASATLPAGAVLTTLRVDGVTCSGCVVGIRKELTALAGVVSVESGTDLKDVLVGYMPGKVTVDQLVAAVKKAGFDAKLKDAATKV